MSEGYLTKYNTMLDNAARYVHTVNHLITNIIQEDISFFRVLHNSVKDLLVKFCDCWYERIPEGFLSRIAICIL